MPQELSSNPESLSVMQWNVWYRAQPERVASHLLRLIDSHGMPDVFCFQELTEPAVEVIADAIGARDISYSVTRVHRNGTKEGQAIMSRGFFGGTGVDTIQLSQGGRAPLKGSGSSQRVLQKATIPTDSNRGVVVANAHTSYKTPTNASQRHQEMQRMTEALGDEETLVLAGDFNATERSEMISTLGMLLLRVEVDGPTWSSSHIDRIGLLKRNLDHVFVTPNLEVATVEVLDQGPSDHMPILTKVLTL